YDTRTNCQLRKDYIVSLVKLNSPGRISYMAIPEGTENLPPISSRHTYSLSDLFDGRAPFVHFEVSRTEFEGKDFLVRNTLYLVRGKERARVPSLKQDFGEGRSSTDWLGYPQEPHLSPDGKWLFVEIKVCHGNNMALLYRRVGHSLSYKLVNERRSL